MSKKKKAKKTSKPKPKPKEKEKEKGEGRRRRSRRRLDDESVLFEQQPDHEVIHEPGADELGNVPTFMLARELCSRADVAIIDLRNQETIDKHIGGSIQKGLEELVFQGLGHMLIQLASEIGSFNEGHAPRNKICDLVQSCGETLVDLGLLYELTLGEEDFEFDDEEEFEDDE